MVEIAANPFYQKKVSITLVYVDGTKVGATQDDVHKIQIWIKEFITATGGTITTCGNYKIHTFTGPGTFTVCCSRWTMVQDNIVDYLVVAGGGGGGGNVVVEVAVELVVIENQNNPALRLYS